MASPPAAATDDLPEFTLRAAVAGVLFGLLFGAANAYLGLRVGLTVSTSIRIAVLTVAFFHAASRVFGRPGRGMILEANMSQTMGSASSSLAAGTIFTIPALFMWGFTPPVANQFARSQPATTPKTAPRAARRSCRTERRTPRAVSGWRNGQCIA